MGRRRIIRSPITKQSICVLRKQSRAFLGAQTAGSFSLNEVLRTIGIILRAQKLSIKR